MTRESDFYIELYQTKFRGGDTKTFQIIGVPIGNVKIKRQVQFHLAAPLMKYHQKTFNSFCLSSLASEFNCINYNMYVLALVNIIEESLTLEKENCKNKIHFANSIMSNRREIKGKQTLRYNLSIWIENDAFDILNDISENIILVQLTDSPGNVNHAISIVGHCIFEYNYMKALCLTQVLTDLI